MLPAMRSKASRVTIAPAPPLVHSSGTSRCDSCISWMNPAMAKLLPVSHFRTSSP